MFKNYLKIALRNLFKQKLYSFINIIGLAIGITSCILIYLFVQNELSYDTFHKNAGRLYRVYITEDLPERDPFSYVEAPWQLAEALKQSFPEVEHAVRLDVRTNIVRYLEKNFTQRYHLVDPDFFKIFTFPLVRGDKAEVLQSLNSVVLTESTAEKIFGQEDPLNKQLSIKLGNEYHDFAVSGIAKDIPANSSIRFDILVPFDNVRKYLGERALSHWFNVFFETYVLLEQPLNAYEMDQKLRSVVEIHYPERYVNMVSLQLQPITDIHLNPDIPSGFEPTSDPMYSYILIAIAFLILGVACINFMTLAIGRSASRTKEVGVRKVLGAVKSQLIKQFLGEAILMSTSALILGIMLVGIFLPAFNKVTNKNLSLSFDLWTILFLATLMFLAGCAAGCYPAFFLARYQPVHVIKNEPRMKGAHFLIRVLVTGQFALFVGLIICTFVMRDQLHFLLNRDLGFNKEHVLVIENHSSQDQNRMVVERLKTSLENRREVLGVTGASSAFAKGWTAMGFSAVDGTFKQFFQITVDYEYLKTMEIELGEGRNFSKKYGTDPSEALIVNEAFVKYFNWESALGKSLPGKKFPPHFVIGVVKDFSFGPLQDKVAPLAIVLDPTTLFRGINDVNTTYSPRLLNFINVRIKPENIRSTIEMIKGTWKKVAPGHPFLFSFLDQDVQQQYEEIERWGNIVGYASFFTILIACLGLFGLATLTVIRRTKEIGIRKVLGASATNMVFFLSQEFGKLVIVANIIAWPVAYYAMNRWLQNFAYRINIGFLSFVLGGVLAFTIAIITVSFQSIRAALANPVESLRCE
ncbi:MAG TPA: FtsX-like permease family protein [Candidatus Aminicenantes bacterium]|nr:FtsX-like permease family protein [Candidatus Aminicenantes bacterium]